LDTPALGFGDFGKPFDDGLMDAEPVVHLLPVSAGQSVLRGVERSSSSNFDQF
jgi:hypothetical protein